MIDEANFDLLYLHVQEEFEDTVGNVVMIMKNGDVKVFYSTILYTGTWMYISSCLHSLFSLEAIKHTFYKTCVWHMSVDLN